MKFSGWMSLGAIVLLVFGVAFLISPEGVLSLYGLSIGEETALMSRYFGQAFVGLAVLWWLHRNTNDAATKRSFGIAGLIGNLIGFVVALMGVLSGLPNALGWLNVALYLIFALGIGQFALPGRAD